MMSPHSPRDLAPRPLLLLLRSGSTWLYEVPWGMRKLLVWIRDRYENPEVIITENGVSDDVQHYGSLNDQQRIRFYNSYINNVLKGGEEIRYLLI